MAKQPKLETERLVLRPLELSDAEAVRQLAGDRAIAENTISIPHPYEAGMAEEWISGRQEMFENQKGVTLAITLKSDGTLIGAMSLMDLHVGHRAELGYWVGRPYWGQGFCTEGGEAMIRYGFEQLGLVRIHASHFGSNPASGKVLTKLGMRHEGRQRHHVKKWDRLEDLELYGLLREDWRP
jgi:RimJ/RimL family protein N-acetyltransferase